MPMINYEKIVRKLLEKAGVEINGSFPWDIQVHNQKVYRRIITQGTLGLGESYMDGWWTCRAVDQLFHKLINAELQTEISLPLKEKASILTNRWLNMQSKIRSLKVVDEHYDSQSEIILSFLDNYKQYSCGYFKKTTDLNTAQEQKLELICKKLMLSSRDNVLDIGCGYGGFARFASERYHCKVTGISTSHAQIEYAKKFCENLPVTFVKSDYRSFTGSFTKILSVGMIEHVGYKNYRALMQMVHKCLQNHGLFLLQTIGGKVSEVTGNPWLMKYIFPNSMLPSAKQIAEAAEGLFVLEDLHNFGEHYDRTLLAWHENFKQNWCNFEDRFDEMFFRMWTYYFLHFAATFRARMNQLWQFVFSKKGIPGGYESIR
jgi:cyclopropane-fatty-acyl-phospholipid synthase